MTITDLTGKIVQSIENPTSKTKLDIKNFSKGVYFLRAAIGENTITKKLTVL
ncbi:MAG: T9SS type A sorting domain-containing protein [Bacteroidetes bacterium]|nr:T9SS type A sorting domain-containing protein [Bacteroidota bacterium]